MCLVVSYNFIAKHFPCWWTEKKAKSFTHLSSLISPKSLLQVDNATASQFEPNKSISISSHSRIHSHSIYINIHMRVRVYLNHRSNLFGMEKKLYTNSNIDRINREVCFVLNDVIWQSFGIHFPQNSQLATSKEQPKPIKPN